MYIHLNIPKLELVAPEAVLDTYNFYLYHKKCNFNFVETTFATCTFYKLYYCCHFIRTILKKQKWANMQTHSIFKNLIYRPAFVLYFFHLYFLSLKHSLLWTLKFNFLLILWRDSNMTYKILYIYYGRNFV